MGEQDRPVVVIGAGVGGLAAAIRLRAMGHSVVVLEARDQPGGRAGVFRRSGYTFDAGPTVITAPHLFSELFELVGRQQSDYVEFVPVDPFYRILLDDGTTFDYVGDTGRMMAQIRRFGDREVEGYRRLIEQSRQIFELGYEQLADQPFSSPVDMMRLIPAMVRLQSWRSVYGLVSRYLKDERLRRIFSFQPLLVGGNPFTVTSIYLLIHWVEKKWGVHFAMGGTTRLVAALVEVLEEVGVPVRLSTPVEEIVVERGGVTAVRTASGDRIPCRFVVCNGDPTYTYRHLIKSHRCRRNTQRRLERMRQSMGLFVGFFGTDKIYPDVTHHTIVMGRRYRRLLNDIFNDKRLADDFSLYLHRPTATDRSLAPDGHDAFYVLSPVPNTVADIDWKSRGPSYFDEILGHLERRLLPGLGEHLTEKFWICPRYFEEELRSEAGAGFGPEPRLGQSAWFRFHNRSPDVDGLYFVGAGVHPGAGLPGVLNSANVTARLVPLPARPIPLLMPQMALRRQA